MLRKDVTFGAFSDGTLGCIFMKTIFIIITGIIFFSLTVVGQKNDYKFYHTEVDTINYKGDSTFAIICTFKNDTLLVEGTGYLIHEKESTHKHRLYKKSSEYFFIDRIVWDGKRTERGRNGTSKITNFEKGKIINSIFYYKGTLISEAEFISKNDNLRGPCGTSVTDILIQGSEPKQE